MNIVNKKSHEKKKNTVINSKNENIESLKTILLEDYLPEAILERNYYLENGKIISRIWIEKLEVSLNNKNNWEAIFDFFNETMTQFEHFYFEHEDYIKNLEINT